MNMTNPDGTRAKETGLGRVARWVVAISACAVLAAIALATTGFTERRVFAKWWLVAAIGLALGLAVWRFFGARFLRLWRALGLPKWILPTGLFALFFAVKAIVILILPPTDQQSDFLSIYQAAQSINAGDLSFNETAYWYFFAYQTPFAIYEAFMLKLFGGSLAPLVLVGALAMAGTNLLVYLIARRITGSAVAGLFAAAAYLVYPSPYLQASH
ncbi:MAG: glycosyltransferase family 39 protein [Bifidobacteriaceae bacterium]|jgi:hypothetical protein|nr:glycosyltransferase family 39 protein [Bifidobacteriaceae bacterium]